MRVITGLTSDPIQIFRFPLDNGQLVKFTIQFKPAVQMWFIDLEYNSFIIRGLRLNNNTNMFCQYKNIIPFGLYIEIADGTEPFLINDLQSERVKINVLTQTEVDRLEEFFQDQNG